MASPDQVLTVSDLRGGRNGTDPPLSLPTTQVVEAVNIDYWDGTIGRKRGGATAVSLLVGTPAPAPMAGKVSAIGAGRTSGTGLVDSFWVIDDATPPVMAWGSYGAGWLAVTGVPTITTPQDVVSVNFNGKTFVACDTTANRLHVVRSWSSPNMDLVGHSTPSAPTAANTAGGGAYAATVRYYKVSYATKSGATIICRSELSSALTFTPDGAHTGVVVTKPATISENETHWELWASADNLVYYLIASTAVATTTVTDSTAPASYATVTGTLAPVVNTNLPPPSAKYLATDGNRLLMAGCYETSGGSVTPKNSRVWFTPVLGTLDIGDDERVPLNNWIDCDEGDDSFITGIACWNGSVYVFKYRQIWKLTPTGNVTTPYARIKITDAVGCIRHQSIVQGQDELGNPALYFLSHRGPHRIGSGGLEYCGKDIEDLWATVNLDATTVVAHGVYHQEKHQAWWWLATSTANEPNLKIVLDTHRMHRQADGARGGWTKHTGASALARCSMMLASAASKRTNLPYIGQSGAASILWKLDTAATDDAGAAFQAYVKTKPYALAGITRNCGLSPGQLVAKSASGVTITLTIDRDFGLATRTATCSLTAAASETRVVRKFDAADESGAAVVQFQIGDAAASTAAWTLDAVLLPFHAEEAR